MPTAPAENQPPHGESYYSDENYSPSYILGSIAGPTRVHHDFTLQKGEATVTFGEPRHTQYVLILESDGELTVERYETERHGVWGDIPPIGGISITEFIKELEGFGTDEDTQAAQFRKEQRMPGTALHTFDSAERRYLHHGATPGHALDHSGGMKFKDTGSELDKTGGLMFEENSEMVIPIFDSGFAFDASRREIVRLG